MKVALVTGASSDIGLALIEELVSKDIQVIGQVNSNRGRLRDLESHRNLIVIEQNLSHHERVKELVDFVATKKGRLDYLVHSIGPFQSKPILELSPSEWRDQIHLNLDLGFYLVHHAKDLLIQSQGHILQFAFSGAEIVKARPESTPYSIAKTGILVLTKSLAAALAPHQVRVNAISPGLIDLNPVLSDERKEMAVEVPAGRPGTPKEIAQVMNWLLFESPTYITGAQIPVSGGWEYV